MYSDGETDAYGAHIWQAELSDHSPPRFTQLTDVPNDRCDQHRYAFCQHPSTGSAFIYLLGPEYSCQRLSLQENQWQTLPNLPLPVDDIEELFSARDTPLMIATSDGQLLGLDVTTAATSSGGAAGTEWQVKVDMGFPSGLSCVHNDAVYTYSQEDNALYRCELLSGDMSKVDDYDLDVRIMEQTTSATASESSLLFSGYHYSRDTLSLLELSMGADKKGVVAGYLENTSPQHQIVVCDLKTKDASGARHGGKV